MNRQNGIPPLSPSFIYSTGFPIPCGYGGAGESGKRAGVPPSRRSMLPPLSPHSQIPTTRQLFNFSPGSGFSPSMSQPSPDSFRGSPSLPPLPSARGSGGSGLPPRKAHKRAKSDNIRGLNSPRVIYPRPIAMPVGVKSQREGESDGDVLLVDVSDDEDEAEAEAEEVSNTSSGVKRRAGKEIAPSASVSMDTSHNGKSPMLPPSPGNLFFGGGGVFTDSEMLTIVGSSKLRDLAASEPKKVKRILASRESAARSMNKKAQYVSDLEAQLHTLETEASKMSAQYATLERLKVVLENENRELRIQLNGMERQAQLRDSLFEQLSGEIERLKIGTGEVSQNLSNSDGSLDPKMFQNLNINQIPQP